MSTKRLYKTSRTKFLIAFKINNLEVFTKQEFLAGAKNGY